MLPSFGGEGGVSEMSIVKQFVNSGKLLLKIASKTATLFEYEIVHRGFQPDGPVTNTYFTFVILLRFNPESDQTTNTLLNDGRAQGGLGRENRSPG